MKKIFTLISMALVAMSVNAQDILIQISHGVISHGNWIIKRLILTMKPLQNGIS